MPTVSADGVYYVDLSATSDFAVFQSVYPENCTFDHMVRGVGNITFQLSLSALDQDGNPAVGPFSTLGSWIGPYRNYWRLRYGNSTILGGVITQVQATVRSDYMTVSGKTWEHFFEKWQYPFDPRGDVRNAGDPVNTYRFHKTFVGNETTGSGAETPTGYVYQAQSRDLILQWGDILAVTMSRPYRTQLDISDVLSGLCGITQSAHFELGNDANMLDYTNGLADTGNGFDWWIGWDSAVHWGSPYRYGNPAAPAIFASVDDTWVDSGKVMTSDFANAGPIATHVFGKGAMLAQSTGLGRAFSSVENEIKFSRLDASQDFGTLKNVNRMIYRTQKQLAIDVQPQHTITITFDPGLITNFWSDFRTGRAINLNINYGFYTVNSSQQLVSYNATLDLSGNATINYTLQQIYNYSLTDGVAEG
jgi:spore coat protein U-like protein